MKKQALAFLYILCLCQLCWGQAADWQNQTYSSSAKSVKRSVATVLFASIGGAVLGLSTLSFYGRPQEHTENITYGALLGFLGGTSFLVFDNTKKTNPTWPEEVSQFGMKKNNINHPQFVFQFSF